MMFAVGKRVSENQLRDIRQDLAINFIITDGLAAIVKKWLVTGLFCA